jgi:hypothetical protein
VNDPVLLRRYVREILASSQDRRLLTERMIFDGVKRLARDPLQVDEFKAALQWNASRNYVVSEPDDDAAHPGEEAPLLWKISEDGLKKEGLA